MNLGLAAEGTAAAVLALVLLVSLACSLVALVLAVVGWILRDRRWFIACFSLLVANQGILLCAGMPIAVWAEFYLCHRLVYLAVSTAAGIAAGIGYWRARQRVSEDRSSDRLHDPAHGQTNGSREKDRLPPWVRCVRVFSYTLMFGTGGAVFLTIYHVVFIAPLGQIGLESMLEHTSLVSGLHLGFVATVIAVGYIVNRILWSRVDRSPPVGRTMRRTFSLRGMFILTTLVAVMLAMYAYRVQAAERERKAVAGAERQIRELGGAFYRGNVNGTFYVDLRGCLVDDAALCRLARCLAEFPGPYLDQTRDLELRLSGTAVTDASIVELRGLNVSCLGLAGTKIADASVETIATFSGLWFLDIRNTGVSDAGYARLKRSLPHCDIQR